MIGMGNQLNEIGWLRGQPVMEGILIVDFSPSHNKDLYYCTYLGLASRGPIFRKRNRTFRRSRTGRDRGFNLSIWCDKRPVCRENQMPLFLSWGGRAPKERRMMGSLEVMNWQITMLLATWPVSNNQKKQQMSHTGSPTASHKITLCLGHLLILECLIRLGSLKFDGNYQYLQVRLSFCTRMIYRSKFQLWPESPRSLGDPNATNTMPSDFEALEMGIWWLSKILSSRNGHS